MTIHVANIVPVALVASTPRTLLQVMAGTTKPLRIKEIGISFNDVDAAHIPIQVDLMRQQGAGTASVTTGIIFEQSEVTEAPIATARAGFSSTEPVSSDILRTFYVTPAAGLFVMQFPLGDEPVVAQAATDASPWRRIAIRVSPGASTTCNAAAYIVFDE